MIKTLCFLSWLIESIINISCAAFSLLFFIMILGLFRRAIWEEIFRPVWLDLVFYVSTQARNIRRRFSRKDQDQ